jgi:lysophospholipase L1-like esterase
MTRVLADYGFTFFSWRTPRELATGVCREGMRPRTWFQLSTLLLAAIGSCGTATAHSAEHWVGTWATAPQAFMPGALETFHNQTVRLIIHTSIAGSKIRIRISNSHGTRALRLGAVRVALARTGPDISSGTDRAVTFGGRAGVMIGAHQTAMSDPVEVEVPASTALAITMFFPQRSPATTSHFLALQTGYVSPKKGNFTAAVRFPVERTIESWPFLTGVDVLTCSDSAAIIVFGDSTVDGDGSTPNANRRWPDLLLKRLLGEPGLPASLAVLNEGLIGNRLLADSPRDKEFGDALGRAGIVRFTRDALDQAGVKSVIVRIGGNDIGLPGAVVKAAPPVTAESLIEGYRKLIALAHARGVRIIGTTIAPSEGATLAPNFYTPDKEAVRQRVNTWLRQQSQFDGLIDVDGALRDPDHPARLLPAYDSGDHLHPGDAGYAASADAVDLSLLRAK